MSLASFFAAYTFLYFWASGSGYVASLPAALWSSDISSMLMVSPTFYLASTAILRGGVGPRRRAFPFLFPPALFAVGFGAYNAITRPFASWAAGSTPGHFSGPMLSWLTTAAILSYLVSIILCLVVAYRVQKAGEVPHRSLFRSQVAFLFVYLAAALLALVACVAEDEDLLRLAVVAIGLIATGFTLTCSKILYFPSGRLERSRGSRHRSEWDIGSQALSARLKILMEKSAPYRDESLSLDRLARMVGVDPKQLSYYFRTSLSRNFRGYINELRLEAVCRDLVVKPEAPILTIAFENGFNSKSSFNAVFFRTYGVTPREYRVSHVAAEPHRG
jgi:AraC-like DNA-binding protein